MQFNRKRTRHLLCERNACEEFTVLHLGFLDYAHYIITVRFYDLEGFHQRYNIKKLIFFVRFLEGRCQHLWILQLIHCSLLSTTPQFKTYDPGFTQIEIWFRFIFLLFTFVVTCWFSHTLRRYIVYDWSIEQKWMSVLLPLLLFYNSMCNAIFIHSLPTFELY